MPDFNILEEEPGNAGSTGVGSNTSGEQLILGRFKTPDDLAKAYQEAETKMTQEAQKRAELERQNQELQVRIQQNPPQQQQQQAAEVNYDELFWQKPTEVINTMIRRNMEPFTMTYWEQQKSAFRQDPNFVKLEPQIDAIASQYPDVKTKPGSVEQLYKMVQGLTFDPVAYENQIREKIKKEEEQKRTGLVEGAQGRETFTANTEVQLTEEEKHVARNMYAAFGVTDPNEAYKKYAAAKSAMRGR
jgi:hypothetical protein